MPDTLAHPHQPAGTGRPQPRDSLPQDPAGGPPSHWETRHTLAHLHLMGIATGQDGSPEPASLARITELAAALRRHAPGAPGRLPLQPEPPDVRLPLAPLDPLRPGESRSLHPVDLSLWCSWTDLREFVYRCGLRAREQGLLAGGTAVPERVLWWVRPGHVPDLAEGLRRLADLRRHGPGRRAFTLRSPVPPPG